MIFAFIKVSKELLKQKNKIKYLRILKQKTIDVGGGRQVPGH